VSKEEKWIVCFAENIILWNSQKPYRVFCVLTSLLLSKRIIREGKSLAVVMEHINSPVKISGG
jgi:hypothetical protein